MPIDSTNLILAIFYTFVATFSITNQDPLYASSPAGNFLGYEGTSYSGKPVAFFSGIRYASAPVGELRYQDPVPYEYDKDQPVPAIEEGPDCMQSNLSTKEIVGQEDCLFLNIYSPNITGKAPIILYIFGGAFWAGSSTKKTYGPQYFMDENVVLVTINYRIGALGYGSTEDENFPGNLGQKDQAEAVRWVTRNIKYFGGDPDNLTLMGHSSGAVSVALLLKSPEVKDLVRRGIALGGSSLTSWGTSHDHRVRNKTLQLASLLGCPTESLGSFDCLRGMNGRVILEKEPYTRSDAFDMTPFRPILNEKTTAGDLAIDAPLLIGFTDTEAALFGYIWAKLLGKIFPDIVLEIKRHFTVFLIHLLTLNPKTPPSALEPLAQTMGDFYWGGKNDTSYTYNNVLSVLQAISDIFVTYPVYREAQIARGDLYTFFFNYIPQLNVEPPTWSLYGPVGDGSVEVRVREGGRAVLPCRAGPTGTTGWRHRGEPVTQDPRYHFDRTAASLIITRARPSDSGTWACTQNGNTVNLVVLESPRAPYLLIDSRRLDAGNLFVPVKENSRLSVECVVEGGSPAPGLHWLLVPPPGSTSPPGLNQQETAPAATHGLARSVANIPRVLRAHHNSTVACIVTHPTLPAPLNASILLDVQFTPSFAITRVPGFGFPLREGIPVSLKCDVDSNPPSSPVWQKDDASPPVEQTADGYLNFTSIRREHSGWYKCTTRHLLSTYSSIGYFLNVRYGDGEISAAELEAVVGGSTEAATGSVEVSVGGAVQLECGSSERGCWGRVSTTGQVSPLGPGAPLAIHSVLYQQAGHYRCYAPEPDRLNAWRTHNVHLKVTGVPMVVAKNSSRTADTGEPLSLLAEYCASPGATKVLWLLPTSRAVAPGSSMWGVRAHNITAGNWPDCHKALLTVDRISRNDHEGDFSLLVWSGRGIGQATIRVNVTGDDDPNASASVKTSSSSSLIVFSLTTVYILGVLLRSRRDVTGYEIAALTSC